MKFWKHNVNIRHLEVEEIFIENSKGMCVSFLNYGGIITGIMVPDAGGTFDNIVLAYEDYEEYLDNPGYFGAIIGRTAGRIKDATFTLNDTKYELGRNYGRHSGHGGHNGFHKKVFGYTIAETDEEIEVRMTCSASHLEEGYPGNLEASIIYSLSEDDVFTIRYEGRSTEDTLINMTNHTYFNLSGSFEESINYHELFIDATYFAELDQSSVPTGHLIKVENTPFDYRYMREIGEEMDMSDPQMIIGRGYDHPFLLNKGDGTKARLAHRFSGRVMEITTDNDALVLYTQNYTQGQTIKGGVTLGERKAVALEVQRPPIGHKECFKENSIVRADEHYKTFTRFRFFTENDSSSDSLMLLG